MEGASIIQFLGAFALVIGLIIALGVMLKRAPFLKSMQTRKSASGQVVLKDSLFIDPKNKCLVLAWRGKEHLVMLSPTQTKLIASHQLDEDDDSFYGEAFEKALQQHGEVEKPSEKEGGIHEL